MRSQRWVALGGLLILLAIEFFRVYFIMPFPGSQQQASLDFAYWMHQHTMVLRLLGFLMLVAGLPSRFRASRTGGKVAWVAGLLLWVFLFVVCNFRLAADHMFYQPRQKLLLAGDQNQVDTNQLVLGVMEEGIAKAYPIQIIGYHHQVRDSLGTRAIMVTYCTVCRTGRVYSPFVGGTPDEFRLVGMDHFNAMFEDHRTGSWWRQVSGEAVAGPLKGNHLEEIPSVQQRLGAWLRDHPSSLVLQPDPQFAKEYAELQGYDLGKVTSHLERRDSSSWNRKSWVLGVVVQGRSRAYDWNELIARRIIEDTLNQVPLLVVVEKDSMSFHVWDRRIGGIEYHFSLDTARDQLLDAAHQGSWSWQGVCILGPDSSKHLVRIPAYQEFWHSWQTFHPGTDRYASPSRAMGR